MVYCAVYGKVRGNAISRISFPDDFTFIADFAKDGETRKNVTFNAGSVEQGIRTVHNLSISFGGSKATLTIEKASKVPKVTFTPATSTGLYGVVHHDINDWQLIALFDVRGMELVSVALTQVDLYTLGDQCFKNIDPSNFCEWSDAANDTVFIETFETKIETIRKL